MNRRFSIIFPSLFWNMNDATLNDSERLKSQTEGWSYRFLKIINIQRLTEKMYFIYWNLKQEI